MRKLRFKALIFIITALWVWGILSIYANVMLASMAEVFGNRSC